MYQDFKKLETAAQTLRENPLVELYAKIVEFENIVVYYHNEVITLTHDLEREKRKNADLKEKAAKKTTRKR